MKKIVGIIAAVAMAASVFAFEWSGAMKTTNTVFTADGTGVKFFQQNGLDSGGPYWGTRLQVAAYLDKAGAKFALGAPKRWAPANTYFEEGLLNDWRVWIDPIDQIRITMGTADDKFNAGAALPQDWMHIARTQAYSITAEIKPMDGLEIDFGITPTSEYVYNKSVNAYPKDFWITIGNNGSFNMKGWGFVAKYKISDDVGTIGFTAFSKNGVANGNLKDLYFGLAYDGKISDDMLLKVSAEIKVAPVVSALAGNIFFQAKFDDLTLAAFAMVANELTANAPVVITPWFKVSYALTDDVTIYLGVNDVGGGQKSIKTDSAFAGITVNPGITWKIGVADLETRLNILIPEQGGQFSMEMPLSVTVGL